MTALCGRAKHVFIVYDCQNNKITESGIRKSIKNELRGLDTT